MNVHGRGKHCVKSVLRSSPMWHGLPWSQHKRGKFIAVGTQRAYFELKYFKIVKMRDAKYSLKMAAKKWRQIFPFLNALYF